MWSLNPVFYLRHAWDSTKTVWGKVSLVVFYTFIWINIILGVWSVIDPESQGMDCIFGNASTRDIPALRVLIRGTNFFIVGFLFYADKGGLHSWNVGFVTVFTLLWYFMWMTFLSNSDLPACAAVWDGASWIWPTWIVLAFVTILLDEKLGDSSTEEERQNLNV